MQVGLLAAFLGVWALHHGYAGIIHDARLYTFQAFAMREPALANDVYLRFGSQDRFTLFSPIYATVMGWLGIDGAAALLTLAFQVAFFVAAAVLARRLMPAPYAWIGMALLCALPGHYGADTIFAVAEPFVTPRLAAEAAVLFGLAAYLDQRYWLAGVHMLVALALHPLMASAGFAIVLFMPNGHRLAYPRALAAAAVLSAMVVAALGLAGAQVRFDPDWISLLRDGIPYLFPSEWDLADWAKNSLPLTTLLIGALALNPSAARSLCRSAVIIAIVGITATFVLGELLQLVLAIQTQPWRWLWLSHVLALLLAPLIAQRLWSGSALSKASLLLLAAAWLLRGEWYVLPVGAMAIAAAAAAKTRIDRANAGRLALFGAALLLVFALFHQIATSILFAIAVPDQSNAPHTIRWVRALDRTGLFTTCAFVLVLVLFRSLRSRQAQLAISALCILLIAPLAPAAVREWNAKAFDEHTRAAFASWRAHIPEDTEVLWFDNPLDAWLILERRSYVSGLQMLSGVFSRPAAMEMKRRTHAIEAFLAGDLTTAWLDTSRRVQPDSSLEATCASGEVRFIVTRRPLSAQAIENAPEAVSARFRGLRLYECGRANE